MALGTNFETYASDPRLTALMAYNTMRSYTYHVQAETLGIKIASIRNKKLVVTSATLVVTGALLVVTRSY